MQQSCHISCHNIVTPGFRISNGARLYQPNADADKNAAMQLKIIIERKRIYVLVPIMNLETQYYNQIPLNLINRKYGNRKAKRFVINHTNQNVWIPNKHLLPDGTIKPGENLNYIFSRAKRQLELAGIK